MTSKPALAIDVPYIALAGRESGVEGALGRPTHVPEDTVLVPVAMGCWCNS